MKKNKLNILLIILLVFYTFSIIHIGLPNDTFFTIPTGNYILNHGLDNTENLTFHDDLNFVKVRYGFDILIGTIYNISGFAGLYVFTVIMAISISLALYFTINKITKSKVIAFIISLIVVTISSGYLICRAQIVSYLIFVLEVYFLYMLSKTGKNKYIIWLTILSIILLAFHCSVWIVYLVFFLPFIAEWIVRKITNKFNIFSEYLVSEEIHIGKLLIALLVVLITGFCTPLGLYPYTYSFMNMGTSAKNMVSELQPLPILKTPILLVLSISYIILVVLSRSKIKISDLCFVIGGILMSTYVERNLYIALMIMAIPVANTINNFLNSYNIYKYYEKLENLLEKHFKFTLIILIMIFASIVIVNYSKILKESYVSESDYPVGAVQYINTHIPTTKMRLFTDYNFGSYVEFNGIKAFLDSRSEIFTPEFSNVSVLDDWISIEYADYTNTTFLESQFKYLVNKYELTHLLVYKNAGYIEYLSNSKQYKEIYSDSYFTLFEVQKTK